MRAGTDRNEAFVAFHDVEKSYDGRTLAVRRLNITVARGEFLTLLGPSGSGKTTTLNMLAGFERPTRGTIALDGRPVDRLPPYQRNIGMVFQNYALFPHMTVADNVAFPLSIRRLGRSEIQTRVRRALEMVRLQQYGDRRPAQLSGGQQQRIALARALVFEPSLVLLDEPLGALDKKLREHMQIELKQLHEMLGVTMIYVTHDQSEALTMSDRIAVFRDGAVVQVGTPDELYNMPQTAFVAGFIGENNLFEGIIERIAGDACEALLPGGLRLRAANAGLMRQGDAAHIAVRPERIRPVTNRAADNCIDATIEGRIYLGDHQRLLGRLNNGQVITVKIGPDSGIADGACITLGWSASDCRAFPADATLDTQEANASSETGRRA